MLRKELLLKDDEYLRKLDVDIPVYYYGFKETDDIYAKNIQITERVRNLMYILKANFMINSYPTIWKSQHSKRTCCNSN